MGFLERVSNMYIILQKFPYNTLWVKSNYAGQTIQCANSTHEFSSMHIQKEVPRYLNLMIAKPRSYFLIACFLHLICCGLLRPFKNHALYHN